VSAGTIRSKSRVRSPRSFDLFEGITDYRLVDKAAAFDKKCAAVVFTKISLRPGDNTDVLEALGLIPPTGKHLVPVPSSECAWCEWVSVPGTDPMIAYRSHRSLKHKGEHA